MLIRSADSALADNVQKHFRKDFLRFRRRQLPHHPYRLGPLPESNQRTLEEMDLLFANNSWWNWDAEVTFATLREQNPELVQAAHRGNSVIDHEAGLKYRGGCGASLVPQGGDENPTDSDEKAGVQQSD